MMLIAAATQKDGRKLLVIGLLEENMKRLADDKPIFKRADEHEVPGLEEWDLTILGPEDTVRFIAYVDEKL
jgi:hypothetical protein